MMIVSAGYRQYITYQRQKMFQVVTYGDSKPPHVTLSEAKDIPKQGESYHVDCYHKINMKKTSY